MSKAVEDAALNVIAKLHWSASELDVKRAHQRLIDAIHSKDECDAIVERLFPEPASGVEQPAEPQSEGDRKCIWCRAAVYLVPASDDFWKHTDTGMVACYAGRSMNATPSPQQPADSAARKLPLSTTRINLYDSIRRIDELRDQLRAANAQIAALKAERDSLLCGR